MRGAAALPSQLWLVGVVAVYTLVLIVAAVAASYWPDPPRAIALVNEFATPLFAPAPLLFLLALLFRARVAIAVAVLPLALFIALYGARFVPTPTASAGPHQEGIVVYTANVAQRRAGFGPLLEQIAHEQPDIVLVQELADGADELDAGLTAIMQTRAHPPPSGPGSNFASQEAPASRPPDALVSRPDYAGVGMWSRFRIVDSEVLHLTRRSDNLSQRIRIDVAGTQLTVYNVHLDPPVKSRWDPSSNPLNLLAVYERGHRSDQVEGLLADVRAQQGPVLLAGDFNLTDRTYDYRRLAEHLTDGFASTGWGLGGTFPAPESAGRLTRLVSPLIRIDYVWAGKDVSPRSVRVVEAAGSDHRGLVARLALRLGS